MIRRESVDMYGRRYWILVRQIDHARLSAEIADRWGLGSFPPMLRTQLLAAIEHHDDGWAEWDSSPAVDSGGRPIAFDEMQLADALAIWRKSIAAGVAIGPLAGYAVAGHFSALLERFDSWRGQGDAAVQQATAFLDEYGQASKAWRDELIASSGPEAEAALEPAVQYLQMFDLVSLWLCIGKTDKPLELQPPEAPKILLREQPSEERSGSFEIRIAPWSFAGEAFELSVPAVRLAQASYTSRDELAAVPSERQALRWHFRPGPA